MSNEADLDWLARNVHEWPTSTPHIVPAGDSVFEFGITFCDNHACVYHSEYTDSKVIYKKQWLARRSELQNKPSWDDFGESAKFMAQDSDGAWMAFEREPAAKYRVWSSMRGWCGYAREGRDRCRGEVLGDWRDTLEKRPEELQLFTSIEDNQEKGMKQDDGWFERGDLPPVGIAVQLWHGGTYAYDCELISKRGNDFVLWNLTWDRPDSADCMMCVFKPTPTERDVLADLIESHGQMSALVVAEAILAAGFSLGAK